MSVDGVQRNTYVHYSHKHTHSLYSSITKALRSTPAPLPPVEPKAGKAKASKKTAPIVTAAPVKALATAAKASDTKRSPRAANTKSTPKYSSVKSARKVKAAAKPSKALPKVKTSGRR